MSITKFKGQPVQIAGEFVKAGAAAPDFELVKTDLSTLSLEGFAWKAGDPEYFSEPRYGRLRRVGA